MHGLLERHALFLICIPLITTTIAESNIPNLTGAVEFYSSAPVHGHYRSSQVVFDPRGLEHLYLLTTTFLDWIQPVGLPPGVVTEDVFTKPLHVAYQNRGPILNHFLGLLLLSLCTLLVAMLLPFGLLCYCCCHRRGPSKRRPLLSTLRRHNMYLRVIYGTFLLVIVLIMMFCVICGFITNGYMESGIQNLPTTFDNSLGDVDLFLNNTKLEVNVLFKTNFRQLRDKLHNKLDRTGEVVHDRLMDIAGVASVDNLTKIVSSLENIQEHLTTAASLTVEMQRECEDLQTALRMARRDLNNLLENCPPSRCSTKYNTSVLAVVSDLSKLPNLTFIIQDISFLLRQNIEAEVKKGKAAFDRLSQTLQNSVNKSIPEIKEKMRRVGQELSSFADNITSLLFFDQRDVGEHVYTLRHAIDEYAHYRWYVFLGICCGTCTMVLCFILGLVYGSCGHSPGSGESGCSKATGGRFLVLGIIFVFLFSSALLAATSVMFLAGAATERGACDLMADPRNPQMHKISEVLQKVYPNLFGLQRNYKLQFNMADLVGHCHLNATLYKAFGFESLAQVHVGTWTLNNLTEITNYRQHYDFDTSLAEFTEHLAIQPNLLLLNPQGEALLTRLRDTRLAQVNYTLYSLMARQHITLVNLTAMGGQLRETSALLPPSQRQVSSELREIASRLENYDKKLAVPIMHKLGQLRQVAEHLKKYTHYDGITLPEVITDLLKQAQRAQDLLKNKGKEEIKKLAQDLIEEMTDLLDAYGLHIKTQVESKLGMCRPLSQAYNASHSGACNEIVLPFNGFWASVGTCTLLSVPGMIIAWKLASLYCLKSYRATHQDPSQPKHRRSNKTESYDQAYLTAMGMMYRTGGGDPSSQPYSPPDRSTPSAPNAETHVWDAAQPSAGDEYAKPPPYFYPPR